MPNFPYTDRGIRKMQRWAKLNIKDKEKLERFIEETNRLLTYIESKKP